MDTDKIIILLSLLIVSFTFVFRNELREDLELLREFEKKDIAEEFTLSYFYPHSQKQRVIALNDHINQMTEFGKRGLFVKYFFNFDGYINAREQELLEICDSLSQEKDFISFSTPRLNNVLATLDFSEEQLLKLAALIDQMFPESEGMALYELGLEGSVPLIAMSLSENFPSVQKQRYREFANEVSLNLFSDQLVLLHVYPSDSEKKLVFKGGRKAVKKAP